MAYDPSGIRIAIVAAADGVAAARDRRTALRGRERDVPAALRLDGRPRHVARRSGVRGAR